MSFICAKGSGIDAVQALSRVFPLSYSPHGQRAADHYSASEKRANPPPCVIGRPIADALAQSLFISRSVALTHRRASDHQHREDVHATELSHYTPMSTPTHTGSWLCWVAIGMDMVPPAVITGATERNPLICTRLTAGHRGFWVVGGVGLP